MLCSTHNHPRPFATLSCFIHRCSPRSMAPEAHILPRTLANGRRGGCPTDSTRTTWAYSEPSRSSPQESGPLPNESVSTVLVHHKAFRVTSRAVPSASLHACSQRSYAVPRTVASSPAASLRLLVEPTETPPFPIRPRRTALRVSTWMRPTLPRAGVLAVAATLTKNAPTTPSRPSSQARTFKWQSSLQKKARWPLGV